MVDTSKIERIPPEHWQNSQLSVAKYYGGIRIHGKMYLIDANNWLVREDILKKEAAEVSKARKEEIKKAKEKQYDLFKEDMCR
jgi:hypothetical protein